MRPGDNGAEVLVVHRPRYDDWSLPKGKADPGESDEDAARREVREETGFDVYLDRELPVVRYVDGRGRPKRVRYWLMTITGGSPCAPNDEVDEHRWIPVDEVGKLLSYPHDRDLISSLERA